MQRDIRDSEAFRRVERRIGDWCQVGSGRIIDLVDPDLSPDGRRVAAGGISVDRLEGLPRQRLCLVDVDTGEIDIVSDSPRQDRAPKWSPDGARVAFIADRAQPYNFQLQVFDVESGSIAEVRVADHWAESVLWSPDGRRILIGAAGTGADMAGAQGGFASPLGREEAPAWAPEIDVGVNESQWRSLWTYDIASRDLRRVSPAGLQAWETAWCGPDALICVASDGPGEETWYAADLRHIDLAGGEARRLHRPKDQIGWISASPSGARIAFVEAVCSDRTIVAGDVLAGGTDGRFARLDTSAVDVTYTAWQGEGALLCAGHRGLETVAMAFEGDEHLTRREIWSSDSQTFGDARYPTVGPARTPGDFVTVVEGHFRRPVLSLFEGGQPRQIRPLGDDDFVARIEASGAARAWRWVAPDGLEIQGWLIEPNTPAPHAVILDVHGGPVWAWRPRFLGRSSYAAVLHEAGYAIFQPNVRGASGWGQDFARRVFGDMGGADTHDYLSGLDRLTAEGLADPKRLGVTGGSYGGFMSAWLITQDQRFAAAAPLSPVTDWVSEHLTCHIPHFCQMFLADEMTNPGGKYFTRSPIMFASQVTTPTLNVCGALDHNTPPGQAQEFHHALLLNGVESVLLTYPQEGHGVRNMPATIDFAARLVSWFETHMPAVKPA